MVQPFPVSTIYVENPTEDLGVANKRYVDNMGVGGEFIIKSVDQSKTTDTTLADDDELFTTLEVGTYYFEVMHIVESAAAPDYKFTMAFAGTSDGNLGFLENFSSSTNRTFGTSQSAASANWPIGFKLYGFAIVTAGGVLSFQWAQNTSSGTACTLKAGSTLFVRKVA